MRGQRVLHVFVVAATALLVLVVVVPFRSGGGSEVSVPAAGRVSASPAGPARYTTEQLRAALPEPSDLAAGFRRVRSDFRNGRRTAHRGAGFPRCNEQGIAVPGELVERMLYQRRSRTPDRTDNGYYVGAIAYPDEAAARAVMGTVQAAVKACPARFRERPKVTARMVVVENRQTWTVEPERSGPGWESLRVLEMQHYPADYPWDDTQIRVVFDYVRTANVVLVQFVWEWGTPAGSAAGTRARASRYLRGMVDRLAGEQRAAGCGFGGGVVGCGRP